MYMLLMGNLTVGYHAVGPFSHYDAALAYATQHVADGMWHIFQVYAPETRDAP